jgi:NADPH-dependent F420 reductase
MTMHKIAVIGGTGPLGRGLGYRFAKAGHPVTIGSRDPQRARTTAAEISTHVGDAGTVQPAENIAAAASAEIAVLAIPYTGHGEIVQSLSAELAGKIVISCVNPLGFDTQGPYGLQLTNGDSAAEQVQQALRTASVVGAFHHLAAANLWNPRARLHHEDIMVCGDDTDAKRTVMELAAAITDHTGIDAGPLRLARQLEPLTAVLISINKRYKIRSGIRVTGLVHDSPSTP